MAAPSIAKLKVKIYADGADKDGMVALAKEKHIKGFTTNPTLMRKAGVTDYAAFAKEVVKAIPDKSISFEVFSDDFAEMERQARIIHSWGKNVFIKIPVMNTRKKSSASLVKRLSAEGIPLNVTALFTLKQVAEMVDALSPKSPAIISVFAGRIADSGHDPVGIMREAKRLMKKLPKAELLWASTRELYNLFQAEEAGTDIITLPHDLLKKIGMVGRDHTDMSHEMVTMFYEDGQKVGYRLYEA